MLCLLLQSCSQVSLPAVWQVLGLGLCDIQTNQFSPMVPPTHPDRKFSDLNLYSFECIIFLLLTSEFHHKDIVHLWPLEYIGRSQKVCPIIHLHHVLYDLTAAVQHQDI